MRHSLLFLMFVIVPSLSIAQNKGIRDDRLPLSPVAQYYKQQLSDQVLKQLNKINWDHIGARTTSGVTLYTIPVVVHVLHNYGPELIPDDGIYNLIANINSYFLLTNPDTVNIIDKFKGVAANTQIAFKLATIDPNGHPTKGIEHIFSYLTYVNYSNENFADQSKINQWPQENYLNVWIVNKIGTSPYGVTGYSYPPYYAAYAPYYDGVMLICDNYTYPTFDAHYFAKFLNLPNACSSGIGCFDNDGIPDTPPCGATARYDGCANLYDPTCDTPNVQNIMVDAIDTCGIMFTYGQGQYMQYILQIDIGNRDSLVTPYNFTTTGMDQPMPDMLPVADFSVLSSGRPTYFFCQNQNVLFKNESWNDTIVAASWSFSNGADSATSPSLTTVNNTFSRPGWVTVSLAATGNNSGTTTLTNPQALYVADTTPVNAVGYIEEFRERGDLDRWPMFNYYNNNFKWQLANTGYDDNMCLQYTGYDSRTFPENATGTPQGDFDDIFTPVFDLTGFTGNECYLNFKSSGATLTADIRKMNDSMEIDYSTDMNNSWHVLKWLSKFELDNKGSLTIPYAPLWMGDWAPHAIPIPGSVRTNHTIFRFRYHPGTDSLGNSTGNNFYLDRVNFNSQPESVQNMTPNVQGAVLMPNPTLGSTYVVINDNVLITSCEIAVSDISGKAVYKTNVLINNNTGKIEIPGNVIGEKGLYLVHIITDRINQTEKLVVY